MTIIDSQLGQMLHRVASAHALIATSEDLTISSSGTAVYDASEALLVALIGKYAPDLDVQVVRQAWQDNDLEDILGMVHQVRMRMRQQTMDVAVEQLADLQMNASGWTRAKIHAATQQLVDGLVAADINIADVISYAAPKACPNCQAMLPNVVGHLDGCVHLDR